MRVPPDAAVSRPEARSTHTLGKVEVLDVFAWKRPEEHRVLLSAACELASDVFVLVTMTNTVPSCFGQVNHNLAIALDAPPPPLEHVLDGRLVGVRREDVETVARLDDRAPPRRDRVVAADDHRHDRRPR
jgi:hypothetical protein